MRRARGFSLVELMVGLALAALVLAGAVQMHWSFNRQAQRQQEIGELQRTLRTAMQILERAVRSAGRGLPASHALNARVDGRCATWYGVQFSDDNPDALRVVAADDDAVLAGSDGGDVRFWAARAQSWRPGDLFVVAADSCAATFEVTRGWSGTPTQRDPGIILARPACDDGRPSCLGSLATGAALHHFSGRSEYRVLDGKLTIGDGHQAIPIADGIEDLQIAVVLEDGATCTAACDFGRAVAVRLTLVGRSPGSVGGAPLRRSLTSLVQLRNYTR